MRASVHIQFVIDENDIIQTVDPVMAPDHADLVETHTYFRLQNVVGESFWHLIASWDISNFYKLVLDAVRIKGQSVTVPFRCQRLEFLDDRTITFTPLPERRVLATTQTVIDTRGAGRATEIEREAQEKGFVYRCSWCQTNKDLPNTLGPAKKESLDMWREEPNDPPIVSHGICRECYHREIAEVVRK